jgi:hypothetical protein
MCLSSELTTVAGHVYQTSSSRSYTNLSAEALRYTATSTFSDRPSDYCRSEKTCPGHATRYRRRPNRVSDVARLKLPLAVCTPVAALNNAVEECLFRKCQPCELLIFPILWPFATKCSIEAASSTAEKGSRSRGGEQGDRRRERPGWREIWALQVSGR